MLAAAALAAAAVAAKAHREERSAALRKLEVELHDRAQEVDTRAHKVGSHMVA